MKDAYALQCSDDGMNSESYHMSFYIHLLAHTSQNRAHGDSQPIYYNWHLVDFNKNVLVFFKNSVSQW